MIPLKLSPSEQEFLGEFCSIARSVKYKILTYDSWEFDAESINKELGNEIFELLMKYDWLTPQKLDSLYDRLHRTGENS